MALLAPLAPACRGWSGGAPLRVAHERLLLAPVTVRGAQGWFIVDTGTSGTIVSPTLASRLEPANHTQHLSGFGDVNRPIDVPRAKSGNIRFAGGRLKYPEEVSVLDVGFLTDRVGSVVDGILGWDVLREYVWGIDVRRARLVAGRRLSPQDVLSSLGAPRADATLRLAIVDELPFVTAEAQGHPLRLLLDTGAERTVLSGEAWKRLGLGPPSGAGQVVIRGVNGDNTGHMARLAALRLGSVAWTGIEVMVTDAANAGDQDGLLGMDLLSDYLMVIDGSSPALYLAKRASGTE